MKEEDERETTEEETRARARERACVAFVYVCVPVSAGGRTSKTRRSKGCFSPLLCFLTLHLSLLKGSRAWCSLTPASLLQRHSPFVSHGVSAVIDRAIPEASRGVYRLRCWLLPGALCPTRVSKAVDAGDVWNRNDRTREEARR